MDFFPVSIRIFIQKRDKERIKRLNEEGLCNMEILRAGIRVWEERKELKPINSGK